MNQSRKVKKIIESVMDEAQSDVTILYRFVAREAELTFSKTSNYSTILDNMASVEDSNKWSVPWSTISAMKQRFKLQSNFSLFSISELTVKSIITFLKDMGCSVDYQTK